MISITKRIPSAEADRKRKFLLVFPILVYPFLTFLLWSIGIFFTGQRPAQDSQGKDAFNTKLPEPKLHPDKGYTKLSYYQQADRDSARRKEAQRRDPFYNDQTKPFENDGTESLRAEAGLSSAADPDTREVYKELAKLQDALNNPPGPRYDPEGYPPGISASEKQQANPAPFSMDQQDEARLDQLLAALGPPENDSSLEMQQLSGIMDKIIAVQHPELMRDSLLRESQKHQGFVYPVSVPRRDSVTFLWETRLSFRDQDSAAAQPPDGSGVSRSNRFYGLVDQNLPGDQTKTIKARTLESQTLASGAVIRLCLADDLMVAGILVPRGSLVYGTGRLNGERLLVAIRSIVSEDRILPVALSAYDMDGIEGIYIPGAMTRQVAKQSGNEAIQALGITTLDPSLGAQATGAGIQAAKSLIGKKIRQTRVTLPAGYTVYLKDAHTKD